MSVIERIEASERMSKVVIHNKVAYLCGQVAEDVTQPIDVQTESALSCVEDLLKKAGSSKEHMLSATIYIRDMKDFDAMNKVWDAWVPTGLAPARACVEARLARPEYLVEICITAALCE